MILIKNFEAVDFYEINAIVGKTLKDIFMQLGIIILSFGDEAYALHAYSSLRVICNDIIVMTDADKYCFPDHSCMPWRFYKNDELHEKSLLKDTLLKTKALVEAALVKTVEVSETADITVVFDNDVRIEIVNDNTQQDQEYYRFFQFQNAGFPHCIIKYYDETIIIEKHIEE